MKFWTIQTPDILNIIEKKGCYEADISKSIYVKQNNNFKKLYNFVLDSFNLVNKTKYNGIVFSFAKIRRGVEEIKNFSEFKELMVSKMDVVGFLINSLKNRGCIILELEYNESFNPIFVDFNDFQYIMPQVTIVCPYTEYSYNDIICSMRRGVLRMSEFPSYIAQAHLPYIKSDNIVNIYNLR